MAQWVQCTRPDGKPVHLNMENATSISPMGPGLTVVAFTGGAEDTVRVTESPEQIMAGNMRAKTPAS